MEPIAPLSEALEKPKLAETTPPITEKPKPQVLANEPQGEVIDFNQAQEQLKALLKENKEQDRIKERQRLNIHAESPTQEIKPAQKSISARNKAMMEALKQSRQKTIEKKLERERIEREQMEQRRQEVERAALLEKQRERKQSKRSKGREDEGR